MTGFREWATQVLGAEAGNTLADEYAQGLGAALDAAVFHGTRPIQENDMTDDGRHVHLIVNGGMTHALHNLSALPRTTDDRNQVTCPRCLAQEVPTVKPETMAEALDTMAQVPPGMEDLTEAERLGLVVGAAYGNALAERDKARAIAVHLEQENAHLVALLEYAVREWPVTSWAGDSHAQDYLVQAIERVKAVGSPETPDTSRSDR